MKIVPLPADRAAQDKKARELNSFARAYNALLLGFAIAAIVCLIGVLVVVIVCGVVGKNDLLLGDGELLDMPERAHKVPALRNGLLLHSLGGVNHAYIPRLNDLQRDNGPDGARQSYDDSRDKCKILHSYLRFIM